MTPGEQISVMVAITFVSPGVGGGAVFFGKDNKGKNYHFVADNGSIARVPEGGEIWKVKGSWELHPKHGIQVRVDHALHAKPLGEFIIHYLAYNRAFKGIGVGVKKAERLWHIFGEELYSILAEGNVDKLSKVLTPVTAAKLVEAWKIESEDGEILYLLANYGLDLRLGTKVLSVWGKESVQKIQENPYRMLAFAGWDKVDRMARSFGLLDNDPRRKTAAVEAYLYRRLEAKHTVTPHEIAVRGVSYILRESGKSAAQEAINCALSDNAVTQNNDGYQPFGAAFMESVIADRFREMIGRSPNPQYNLFTNNLNSAIEDTVKAFEQNNGITINDQQRAGILMAINLPLSVLTGGAGVGKTTVLRIIHQICEQLGITVKQMALSGRAAQRMREATGREATTIAKFLREAADGKVNSHIECLIIIDESSMLDLSLMYSIVRVLPEKARLLFVGDPYQLPPIGFGLVFQILVASSKVPRVELTKVHRQAQSTGIPQIAFEIRHGVVPQVPVYEGAESGVYFVESADAEIVESIKFVASQMNELGETQILGITKRGNSGVFNINASFHAQHLTTKESPAKIKTVTKELVEGEPVIHLTNDYEKELWNGSLGVITHISQDNFIGNSKKEARSIFCNFDGIEHKIPESDLNNIDLAYAITVHKAQGSQFKRIIVPVSKSRLLDRTLLYTALTRGIEQVVFIGNKEAFDQAIISPPLVNNRNVGFSI